MKGFHVSRFTLRVWAPVLIAAALLASAWAQAPAQKNPPPPATAGGKATPAAKVAPGQAKPWLQIPVPPLPAFHPQQPRRVQLGNGMVIFLQEDHELPTIDGTMRIRGGSNLEPKDKIGLVDMYGEVWRTGGTQAMTGDQMDDFLEARAAKVETDGGTDSTSISFSCLKGDFEDVFKLFTDLLRNPAFREDKLELARRQLDTGIARRNDDIDEIAGRESTKLAYGPENPYARVPEYYTVAAVSQSDLAQWHQRFVAPNNVIVGIVGDFDAAQMEARLRQAFESWPAGPPAPKPEIQFQPAKPGIYFVRKTDVDQSAIRMVTLGIRRDNPDYYAVQAMNEVLGGGFSSRLFSDLRTKKGLAYSVGGGIGAAYDHPGIFRLGMGTKSATTVEAIKGLDEELQNMLTHPATAEELKRAKDSILNSFIFNFDSKAKVLRERMAYEFYGYPADFLERYRAGIEKVATADVARVAEKYIHPQQFAVLVVGNDEEFGEKLSSLGPVTPVDIAIPTAPPGQPAAAAASNPEGKALMAKVIEAMGGAAKVDSIKSLHTVSMIQAKTPQGDTQIRSDVLVAYPDRMRSVRQTPQGEMLIVVTPAAASLAMGAQSMSLPPPLREDFMNQLKRDEIAVAQHVNDPQYTFAAGPTETINGVAARALDINADGAQARWWVDPQTGHIVRIAYTGTGMQGPVQRVVDLSDWKTVEGMTFAFKRVISENGQQQATVEMQEVQLNPPVDAAAFNKPAAQ
jgi:zinc protease